MASEGSSNFREFLLLLILERVATLGARTLRNNKKGKEKEGVALTLRHQINF